MQIVYIQYADVVKVGVFRPSKLVTDTKKEMRYRYGQIVVKQIVRRLIAVIIINLRISIKFLSSFNRQGG